MDSLDQWDDWYSSQNCFKTMFQNVHKRLDAVYFTISICPTFLSLWGVRKGEIYMQPNFPSNVAQRFRTKFPNQYNENSKCLAFAGMFHCGWSIGFGPLPSSCGAVNLMTNLFFEDKPNKKGRCPENGGCLQKRIFYGRLIFSSLRFSAVSCFQTSVDLSTPQTVVPHQRILMTNPATQWLFSSWGMGHRYVDM